MERAQATRTQRFLAQQGRQSRLEWLPGYAPDLNPVEQVCNHLKGVDLANLAPADLDELEAVASASIARKRGQSALLLSFFETAQLRL